MKILVDCATAKVGGARTYLEEFLKTLAALGDENHWIVYTGFWPGQRLPAVPDFVEIRMLHPVWARPTGHLVWLASVLPKLVRREGVDAVFAATGFGMPRPCVPQAILIRNPIYFSEVYSKQIVGVRARAELALRRRLSLWMIRSSTAILFPTKAMADLVAQYQSLDESRVVIAPYGCDLALFGTTPSDSGWLPEPLVREKKRFLLNVSLYSAQKNFAVLFSALGILRRQNRVLPLVLTTHITPAPSPTYAEDRRLILQGHLEEQVLAIGPIAREKLPALYHAAGLFVFPSYVESFGHPLVEAMAAGLPILAADTQVNREVCGPAAAYVPPFNPQLWATEIVRLLENPQERSRLSQAAKARAACFSWRAHVQTVQLTLARFHAGCHAQSNDR